MGSDAGHCGEVSVMHGGAYSKDGVKAESCREIRRLLAFYPQTYKTFLKTFKFFLQNETECVIISLAEADRRDRHSEKME